MGTDNGSVDNSEGYVNALNFAGFGRYQYLVYAICGFVHACDAIELVSLAFILPAATSDLHLTGEMKGLLTASVFAGMLFGGWTFGSFADKFGRRPVLAFAIFWDGVFALASAFSPTYGWLLALRFLAAFGVGGAIPVVFTLFIEYLPADKRQVWTILMSMTWMIGAVMAAGLAWIVIPSDVSFGHIGEMEFKSWRVFILFAAMPSLISVILLQLMDDSPRFLYFNGQELKAVEVLLDVWKANKNAKDVVEIADARRKITDELESDIPERSEDDSDVEKRGLLRKQGSMTPRGAPKQLLVVHESGIFGSIHEILARTFSLFKGSYTISTIMLTVIWFTMSFGFYGLTLWLPEYFRTFPDKISIYSNYFLVSLLNLPGVAIAVYLIKKVGALSGMGRCYFYISIFVFCYFASLLSSLSFLTSPFFSPPSTPSHSFLLSLSKLVP